RSVHVLVLVAGPRAVGVVRPRRLAGRTGPVHDRVSDAPDVGPGAGRGDLVRPARAGGALRARPDQRPVDALPGGGWGRAGPARPPLALLPPRGGAGAAPRPERRGEPRTTTDQRSHVRHLPVRRDLEATGRGLVGRAGDVGGVREPGVPVGRHDVAGP